MRNIKNMKKSAANSIGAAFLILIILVLIVLAVSFMSEEDREYLLNGTNSTEDNGKIITGTDILVLESPGTLDYISQTEMNIEHSIPSFNLYTKTESQEMIKRDSVYITNAILTNKPQTYTFTIDKELTENMVVSANVNAEHRGRLIIKLNGYEVFNEEVDKTNLGPVTLPDDYLFNGDNEVEVSVSSPGVLIWLKNHYTLTNFKIVGDITDISHQTSNNMFIVSSTERSNIDTAALRFIADCTRGSIPDTLTIELNDHELFSGVPDCGAIRQIEFVPSYLNSGENYVFFETLGGSFLIDNIVVKTELKKMIHPTYYFEIEEDEYNLIEDGQLDILLDLEFTNDVDYKKADIVINGHTTSLDTYDKEYSKNIGPYIREGNNAVEITPKTRLNVLELKVYYD